MLSTSSSSHTELSETDIVVITLFSVVSVVAVVLVLTRVERWGDGNSTTATVSGVRDLTSSPHISRTTSGRKRVLTRSTRQSSSSSSSSATSASSQHTCTHYIDDAAGHDTLECGLVESNAKRVPRRRNIIRRVALTATGSAVGN